MKYRHHISIHPHTRKDSPRCQLFMVVSVCGERKEVPLGISMPVDAYDKSTMSIVHAPGYTSAAVDNLNLQTAISNMQRILLEYELSATPPTLHDALVKYSLISGTNISGVPLVTTTSMLTVRKAYDQYLASERLNHGWSLATDKRKKHVGNRICQVLGKKSVCDINEDDLLRLMNEYTDSLKASTLDKLVSEVRVFLRWCSTKGYYKGNMHQTFHPVIKGAHDAKEIIFLTADELVALETHVWKISEQSLERVVDSFVFACYCGLRHSDVYALKRTAIYEDCIHVRIIKTGALVSIPLNSHTQRILDKYADYHDALDHPFPILTDQKSNLAIKEACKICKIDTPTTITYYRDNKRIEETHPKHELVSFHCARRTFISQAFRLGISPDIIIKFTAHASTRQLKPYLAITDKQKASSMQLFDTIKPPKNKRKKK